MYRRLCYVGHLSWARLQLDRLDLVLRSSIPGYGSSDPREEEFSVLEEYMFNHPERSAFAEPS